MAASAGLEMCVLQRKRMLTCQCGHMIEVLLLERVIQPVVYSTGRHHGHQSGRTTNIKSWEAFPARDVHQHCQWAAPSAATGCAKNSGPQHI